MEFTNQLAAVHELESLAKSDRHSVLISGPQGCGKSYLAKYYAALLNITDYQEISPRIDEVRSTIDNCISIKNNVVICVENIDSGVAGVAYTLLKFLEEPASHVYIVITAQNIQRVPDTILSRSTQISLSGPLPQDIETYASAKNFSKFHELENTKIWKCVNSFSDADLVLGMSAEHHQFFTSLETKLNFNDSISNMAWQFTHYPDNSEVPVHLVIRYIMNHINSFHAIRCGIDCMRDLSMGRLAGHAVISKFLFDMKYTE